MLDFSDLGLTGSYGYIDTSFDVPMYEDMPALDLASAGQAVETVGVNDGWSGFFKEAAKTALDYSIKRDAALTGAELRTQLPANYGTQPYYGTGQQRAGQISPLLLIAGAVAVVLIASK